MLFACKFGKRIFEDESSRAFLVQKQNVISRISFLMRVLQFCSVWRLKVCICIQFHFSLIIFQFLSPGHILEDIHPSRILRPRTQTPHHFPPNQSHRWSLRQNPHQILNTPTQKLISTTAYPK